MLQVFKPIAMQFYNVSSLFHKSQYRTVFANYDKAGYVNVFLFAFMMSKKVNQAFLRYIISLLVLSLVFLIAYGKCRNQVL